MLVESSFNQEVKLMANARSKNTRSVPSKKVGRYRPPVVPSNPPKQQPSAARLVVNTDGKKRMIKDNPA